MSESPAELHSRYSYNAIFSDICKTRFNNMVIRFFLNTIILQSLFLTLISRYNSSLMQGIVLFFPKFLSLYFVSLFVIITRKNFLHVNSLGYSTFSTQIVGQLCSFKFLTYQALFTTSSVFVGLTICDSIGLASLDQYTLQYYRIFVWLAIPSTYSVQHLIFDLDKLSFSIDSQHQAPQKYIILRVRNIFLKSIVLAVALLIISPFIFNSIASSWTIPFTLHFKLFLISFLIFLQFEFINVAFNAHMSIGCLHKGKTISSLSPTPIETLISGLSSKKPFTKLTAFQELSYRATSNDSNLRLPIYTNPYRNTNLWATILKECLAVIQETNDSVNKYLNGLEKTLKSSKPQYTEARNNNEGMHGTLFGNTPDYVLTERIPSFPGVPVTSRNENVLMHRISLRDENVLLDTKHQNRNNYSSVNFNKMPNYIDSQHAYNDSLVTRDTKLSVVLRTIYKNIQNSILSFFFPSGSESNGDLNNLSLLEVWYLSKDRVAEKLVPLPICHTESVVSLMGLLIKSIDESPKGSVVASVGEVLKHLERSVAILGRYDEWNPNNNSQDNLDRSDESRTSDVISLLYELSISAFLEIVLKYNVLLNDVYLDEDVIKLSKWVLDMCASEENTFQ